MRPIFKILLFIFFVLFSALGISQRAYKPHSVLSTGAWAKIAVSETGVYKMDVSFFASIGITGTIPAGAIRIFGNGGAALPEGNSTPRIDDLEELAIMIIDGGDGVLNGSDHVLFFASGPHQWLRDTTTNLYYHKKNIYSDESYYYITVGGVGKRIAAQAVIPAATIVTTSFTERWYHELDSINFLSSGKEWAGEEFAANPGRTLTRTFAVPFNELVQGQPAQIVSNLFSRSVGAASSYRVMVNNMVTQQITVPQIGGTPLDLFAQQVQERSSFINGEKEISVSYNYVPGGFNAQGWLNWFELFIRRSLSLTNDRQLLFRDEATVGNNGVSFLLNNATAAAQVWDVTNPLNPQKMNTTVTAGQLQFANEAQTLHEYVAFSTAFLSPKVIGKIDIQDLHNTTETDYMIITHPLFKAQAERLAQFHQQRGLKTKTVTTEQIFNEFSSGSPDPTAIRDFIKMYYDKYRSTWKNSGKYVALFGKASFDYKARIKSNTSFVPCYETKNSLDPLATYTSDDFFGFLDDDEDINSGTVLNDLDIGIGRIPAKTEEEAKAFVDKVLAYHAAPSLGPWRSTINFVADDEDNNLHLQDAEILTATSVTTAPLFNINKNYLDAFKQEGGSAGGRYPMANVAINNSIYNGTLIWNYSGHGGALRLAEEVVLERQIVANWKNENRLPLFITATCDFAPYDNPLVNSLGEDLIMRPKTGAVALMTTTRTVFAFSNRVLNDNYLRIALQQDSTGKYKTLGEAIQAAKNYTYQTFGDVTNNRKFALLGDPAMTLAFPKFNVTATVLNGVSIVSDADTLQATEMVNLQGEIRDDKGALLPQFNGTVYLSLFDKPQTVTTLGNDPSSFPVPFSTQSAVLFKGKATATAGRFSFNFKLPKDINYQYGKGKISLYAQNGTDDGGGFSTNVIVGGISTLATADKEGPSIKAYLDNEQFVPGSITGPSPVLILQLADSSGINTGGNGIGHDLIATLDNDNRTYYELNAFYESDLDNYQKGSVRYQLPELSPGPHSLKIKAWDAVNNSAEYTLEFIVNNRDELVLDHVLNYPNPFTTKTSFWFEHNQPGTDLKVKVEIFTVSGKLVKTLQQTINNAGNRSSELEWDGRDDFGEKVGKGVYVYRLQVIAPNGKKVSRLQKLLLFR